MTDREKIEWTSAGIDSVLAEQTITAAMVDFHVAKPNRSNSIQLLLHYALEQLGQDQRERPLPYPKGITSKPVPR